MAIPLGRPLPCASSYLPADIGRATRLAQTARQLPAYLVLHQVEIARFTLHTISCVQTRLCCSNPHLAMDGCYPLPCSVESGPSSANISLQRPSGALPNPY
jgi:hypothetical protein